MAAGQPPAVSAGGGALDGDNGGQRLSWGGHAVRHAVPPVLAPGHGGGQEEQDCAGGEARHDVGGGRSPEAACGRARCQGCCAGPAGRRGAWGAAKLCRGGGAGPSFCRPAAARGRTTWHRVLAAPVGPPLPAARVRLQHHTQSACGLSRRGHVGRVQRPAGQSRAFETRRGRSAAAAAAAATRAVAGAEPGVQHPWCMAPAVQPGLHPQWQHAVHSGVDAAEPGLVAGPERGGGCATAMVPGTSTGGWDARTGVAAAPALAPGPAPTGRMLRRTQRIPPGRAGQRPRAALLRATSAASLPPPWGARADRGAVTPPAAYQHLPPR